MGKPCEPASDKKRVPQRDLTRPYEALFIIAEYMDDLREMIEKLRRRLD